MIDIYKKYLAHIYQSENISIISNDCWGGQFYRHLGLEYNTPFVGLFMFAPCYLDMVSNFENHILSNHLFEISKSKYEQANEFREQKKWFYPIGLLNNEIEIHFMHYKTWSDALNKWNTRKSRINLKNLAFKFDGSKDLATPALVERFKNLPFQKKIILSKGELNTSNGIVLNIPDWQMDGAKMYKISLQYFDINVWLKSGKISQSTIHKAWYKWFVEKDNKLL